MSFEDIACHVWAIDGYVDDETAEMVNNLYNQVANTMEKVAGNKHARSAALKALVDEARVSPETDPKRPIIVYGGFRRNQNAPEHMWIEYNDYIYETMPGKGLEFVKATRKSRQTPPLENEEFVDANVGVYNTFMTVKQKAYLQGLSRL